MIRYKDISFVNGVLHVKILTSKSNQFAEKSFEIVIVPNLHSMLCPVYWVKELFRLSKPDPEDKLFRLFAGSSWVAMKQSWFAKKFK